MTIDNFLETVGYGNERELVRLAWDAGRREAAREIARSLEESAKSLADGATGPSAGFIFGAADRISDVAAAVREQFGLDATASKEKP